jgi:PhnO protein
MEAGDAESVCQLIDELGYRRTAREVDSWIEGLDAADRQTALVACIDGVVAGWIEVSIELRLQSPPFALIGGLVVADGMRNRGIGRFLCQAAEEWARGRGMNKVRVTSRSTRADAHRFYLRDGYEAVKTSMVFDKDLQKRQAGSDSAG